MVGCWQMRDSAPRLMDPCQALVCPLSLYIWNFMETKLSSNIPNKGCRYFSLLFCGVVLFSWRGFLFFPPMLVSLALLSNLPYEGPTHLIFSYYLPSCFFTSLLSYLLCSLSFFSSFFDIFFKAKNIVFII